MESTQPDLFAAIKAGEFERVKTLVSADPALVNARSSTGESAILTAVYNGRKEIANLLVARGATLTLFEASAAGEFDRAERLLEQGAAVNAYQLPRASRKIRSVGIVRVWSPAAAFFTRRRAGLCDASQSYPQA